MRLKGGALVRVRALILTLLALVCAPAAASREWRSRCRSLSRLWVEPHASPSTCSPLPSLDVAVDPARLQSHRVTLGQVIGAVGQGNQDQPSGAIEQSSRRFDFRVLGQVRTPEQLGQLLVTSADGQRVRIADVATVQDTFKTPTIITRANGRSGLAGLLIYCYTFGKPLGTPNLSVLV